MSEHSLAIVYSLTVSGINSTVLSQSLSLVLALSLSLSLSLALLLLGRLLFRSLIVTAYLVSFSLVLYYYVITY